MHGYMVEILDLFTNHIRKQEFIDKIKNAHPDMIGISAYTENINAVIHLTKIIKSVLPKIIIVLGGAHVTFLPEVKGISYRVGQEIIHNADRGYIENLDNLPWAELDEIEMRSYDIKQLIITSRGCPGKCIYCASAALSGTRYRNRSAQNVFSEIHYKYIGNCETRGARS